jgi:isocitrate dehydrogenase kinase/phosphatase
MHPDIADAAFWMGVQDRIRDGVQDDIFPYPQQVRFVARYV